MSSDRLPQLVEIECSGQQNAERKACIACDYIDERIFWTPGGAGPFCGDCLDALCDPDQSLLLEQRLESYEKQA